MSDKYTSSIVSRYGDRDNVPKDCRAIYDIIARQGASLLIDCISEHAGRVSNETKLSTKERENLLISLVEELRNALKERT